MNTNRPVRLRRGVSLIEAVVALAVMAFGLVAIVGLQATLRSNADMSKQRAEAVRIAQEEIERWRAFVTLQADAGVDFTDIADMPDIQTVGLNANYTVSRSVPQLQAPAPKTVAVNVSWVDRTGQTQTIALNTAIAGISPELAGALVLPQNSGSANRVNNRHPLIPRKARDFGDGTSGFVPPQGAGEKVAWVFNNVTGLIERTCLVEADASTETLSAASVAANLDSCDTSRTAQLLSGHVNFAGWQEQPDETEAEAPTGLPLNLDMKLSLTSTGHPEPAYACFDDSPQTPEDSTGPVTYFCAIYSNQDRTWSGRLRVLPLAFSDQASEAAWSIGTEASEHKVCRYTVLADDGSAKSKNSAHPLDYSQEGSVPGASLRDQNFLVVRGSHSCPADALTSVDPVNSNTRVHQNGLHPYT